MSNGPLPSQLCLLSDLRYKHIDDKVRFLGCVTLYNSTLGILTLRHEHPSTSRDCALVDVQLLLERLTSEQLRVGEWINIIGTVTAIVPVQPAEPRANQSVVSTNVHIQAIILWSTGPLDIQNYEKHMDNWSNGIDTGV